MVKNTPRQTRNATTGETFTVRLVGVDGYDLTLWDDAWKTHPERMSWARIRERREQRNGRFTVMVEVDRRDFLEICDPETDAGSLAGQVRLLLDEIAREAMEDDYLRGEVMSLPRADDRSLHGSVGFEVEWPVREAAWIVQSVRLSTGEVGKIHLHRIEVGPEIATLRVRLPEPLAKVFAARTGSSETLSVRLFACIEAAYIAEQNVRLRLVAQADDTEIPF